MIPFDPNDNIGFLIQGVARLMRRDFERRAQSLGLTQAQWRVLSVLSVKEGINQAKLADILEIQPITLTRQIDRLEAAGWVVRRVDPRDRRAMRLAVTDKAGPILKRIWDLAAETGEAALADLSPTARKRFLAMLRRVKANLMPPESCAEDEGKAEADRKTA